MDQPEKNVLIEQPATDDCPPLRQLYVYVTDGCNLACRHCWLAPRFDAAGEKSGFLFKDIFASVIDEARPLGLDTVKLTGGEPLLHPDFTELIYIIRDKGLGLVLETNGLLCNAGMADKIARLPRRFVSVSIDGVDASTHDRIRGVAGAFEKACAAVRNLSVVGVRPQIIMTVMRVNMGQVNAMVDLAERLGAESVKFNVVQPTARGEVLHSDCQALGIGELIALGNHVDRDLSGRTGLKLFFDLPMAFRSLKRMFDGDGCAVCGIFGILGLLADGHYALCGIGCHVPELVFGEAGKDRLAIVWKENRTLMQIREGLPKRMEGVCAECLMKGRCLGSCLAQNYYRQKSLWAPHWFCETAHDAGLFPRSRLVDLHEG